MSNAIFKSSRPLIVVAIVALAAAAGSAKVLAKESVEQRLQHLEDKEAITAVLERFFEYQETRQLEKYAHLFSKDGEMILRLGRSSGGPAGILAGMTRNSSPTQGGNAGAAAGTPASSPANRPSTIGGADAIRMRHVLSNVHIELKGDTATAQSRFTLLSVDDDNRTRLGGSGRYRDDLVRENGEWKILKRVIFRDLPLDLEGANPAKE
ncbi:MAG: nuclear transport factor 2 family protein [Pseudomonadota bacterium]